MEYQKTYLLATAKVTDIEPELCPTQRVELASARQVTGQIPVVPALEDQKDLTKLVAILLSTGINRNDDAFLPSEILPVRNTGAHKPVNLEHDPTQIIGHILRSFATEKDGDRVPDKNKPTGRAFDITAEAVLYSFLFPELVRDIKDRANSNNLFVSVEVWFTAFDFVVGSQIIKRNQKTASQLEGRLKVNGGDGFFEGKRLGRVLRNMIIGGIGVVKDPANPESIIKSVNSFDSEVVQEIEDETISQYILCDLSSSDQNIGDNFVEQEVSIMNPEILEEMAALASAIQAASNTGDEITEIPVEVDESNTELQAIASRMEKLETANSELKIRTDQAEFKVEAARRENKLREVNIPEEMLERHLTRCFRMTQDQFEDYVGLLVDTVNMCVLKTQASVTAETEVEETIETVEGGDVTSAEDVSAETDETTENIVTEIETAEVETDTVETVETEVEAEEVSQPADTAVEIEDEVEIDIEAVDPEINTEGDGTDTQPSLTDKMGDIVQQFLKHKDKNWEKLAINK